VERVGRAHPARRKEVHLGSHGRVARFLGIDRAEVETTLAKRLTRRRTTRARTVRACLAGPTRMTARSAVGGARFRVYAPRAAEGLPRGTVAGATTAAASTTAGRSALAAVRAVGRQIDALAAAQRKARRAPAAPRVADLPGGARGRAATAVARRRLEVDA